jgi:hypothetical protein
LRYNNKLRKEGLKPHPTQPQRQAFNALLNELKAHELIKFKNGVGYFLIVDYSVAINILMDS